MDNLLTQRVATRYYIRNAARTVINASSFTSRKASTLGITPAILEAFAEGFYIPQYQGRVAFGGLVQKLHALLSIFTKAPQLWEQFKTFLGVINLTEIPKVIKEWAQKGYAALRKIVTQTFNKWPLKIYTLEKGKLKSTIEWLNQLTKKYPAFSKWLNNTARPLVNQFDQWLKDNMPVISKFLLGAIYFWIWFNVVEYEWDVKNLIDTLRNIMSGSLTLVNLFANFPAAVIGSILRIFGFNSFTLIPATIALRFIYLMAHRYIFWTGKGFEVNQTKFQTDFNIEPERVTHLGMSLIRL